jgi:Family of unknown function (DUF5723)
MRRITIAIAFILFSIPAWCQFETTFYFMNSLPQVSVNNPAFVPNYRFSVGLPLISSFSQGYYNSGFSYNDLITKTNGEVTADLSKFTKSLASKNYITSTYQIDVFRVGFRATSRLYMQVYSTAHAYARAQMPKEIASIFVQGTTPLVGTTTSFSPQGEGLSYLETGLGAAYQVDDRLTLGARLKYLNGAENVTTIQSTMNLTVGNSLQITSGDDMVKTSGIHDPNSFAKNLGKNSGFGIDLGATFKVTPKLTLAASVIDLGRINWKGNTYSYAFAQTPASYTFSGIDFKDVIQGNTKALNAELDSLKNKFKVVGTPTGSYRTWLPGKMYVSGNYAISRTFSLGTVFFSEKFQDRISAGGGVSVNKHFGKWLSGGVSYSISNRSYNNLGLGVSFNMAPVQIYFAGDNLLGIPTSLITTQHLNSYINNTKVFNLRFGINFVWGRNKDLDKLDRNTKSYNSTGKTNPKTKVTKGDPSYLKVRKKRH